MNRLSDGEQDPEDSTENSVSLVASKRVKLNDSNQEKEGQTKFDGSNANEPNSMQDDSSNGKALRNPIILRNIFRHFSTKFLLSSCSLVNKMWNRDVRIFIRNSRKCVAVNPDQNSSLNTCQLLQDLNNLCSRMREQRREIPFNGLKIELLQSELNQSCPVDSGCDEVTHVNPPSVVTLKYLEITCSSSKVLSQTQDASSYLIRKHAAEIKDLTTHSILRLDTIIRGGLSPIFPRLEEITISEAESNYKTVQTDILTRIIESSPNLKKLCVADPRSLEIVSKEHYGLLGNLEIFVEDVFDEDIPFPEIVDKKPKLRELTIYEAFNEENANGQESLNNFIKRLLTQSCQESLEDFNIYNCAFYTLTLMSNIALKRLSTLCLETGAEAALDEFWNALGFIDGDKIMPKLEEVELKLEIGGTEDAAREWPPNNPDRHVCHSYSSVRKLTLVIMYVRVTLMEIKSLFPNVTSLQLRLYSSEHVPCREFFELWPNLEELRLSGMDNALRRNYDAEFCGINEEEVELLRTMDDDYLQNVHVVPIRPSLLTMPHLRAVSIDFDYRPAADAVRSSGNSPPDFISKVTELVALKRISQRDATIIWACQSEDEEDSESSEDGDDDDDENDDDSVVDSDGDNDDDGEEEAKNA